MTIEFFALDEEGRVTSARTLDRSTILACPMIILLPEHYREDGTCRCKETTCEWESCKTRKFNDEIYCKRHLAQFE